MAVAVVPFAANWDQVSPIPLSFLPTPCVLCTRSPRHHQLVAPYMTLQFVESLFKHSFYHEKTFPLSPQDLGFSGLGGYLFPCGALVSFRLPLGDRADVRVGDHSSEAQPGSSQGCWWPLGWPRAMSSGSPDTSEQTLPGTRGTWTQNPSSQNSPQNLGRLLPAWSH